MVGGAPQACVGNVERNVGKVVGVQHIRVALVSEKAKVAINPSLVSREEVAAHIRSLGYGAELIEDNALGWAKVELVILGMAGVEDAEYIETRIGESL